MGRSLPAKLLRKKSAVNSKHSIAFISKADFKSYETGASKKAPELTRETIAR
jgi:hypothetical protein